MAVTYSGKADVRELSARDLKTLGVEGSTSALRFERGVPQEVDPAVAEVLVNDDRLKGQFKLTEEPKQVGEEPVEDEDVPETGRETTTGADTTATTVGETTTPTTGRRGRTSGSTRTSG